MRGIMKCLMGSMLATAMALPVGGFADGSAQQPTGQAVRAGSRP